jgi:hypothetical protein
VSMRPGCMATVVTLGRWERQRDPGLVSNNVSHFYGIGMQHSGLGN